VTNTSVSTPNLCYYLKQNTSTIQHVGIMITASHNPAIFNGLKIKAPYGGPIPDWLAKEIEKHLDKTENNSGTCMIHPSTMDEGLQDQDAHAVAELDIKPQYIDYLKLSVDFNQIKKLKKCVSVFDSMHGCAAHYLTELFSDNLKSIIQIRNFRDSLFGSINPEPIEKNLNLLTKTVTKTNASIGIAFDGDADRIGVIDDKGDYLPPHIVFPLLLYYLVKYKNLTGKVVQTISLGYLSERIARKFNIGFEEVPIGFKYITEKMLTVGVMDRINGGEDGNAVRQGVLIGGEESGGYALCGEIPDRDGILSGLILLEMLGYTGRKLSALVQGLQKEFGKSYFLRIDIELPEVIFEKNSFTNKLKNLISTKLFGIIVREVKSYDGLKIVLQDDSWLLMRPSGTEPVLRIYAEAPSREFANKLIEYGKKLTQSVIARG
ncbi:MAG: hypothetical protein QME68_05325, partial [Elusimicrobiota bacterium]|nr:hypothetical protein [Elusimicrobiota bacterium]